MATDESGEPLPRLFDPALDRCTRDIPRPELVVYNEDKQVSQLQMTSASWLQPSRDASSVVIHIDGACRGNGTPSARASYGVYAGPESRHSTSGLLAPSLPQTSSRAQIEALARALDAIHAVTVGDFELSQIKVASDSSFLVSAMAVWMDGWLANGGVSSRGGRVARFERLRQLNERLDEMECRDDGGIEVQFWHVPREMNREADALANTALGSA